MTTANKNGMHNQTFFQKDDAPVKIFWPKEQKHSKYLKLSKKLSHISR